MSEECSVSRLSSWKRLVTLAVATLCLAPLSPALSAGSADNIHAKLQHLADRDGAAVFLAIYWLPESREWFLSCVGETQHWSIASPQEFEKALSPQQGRDVLRVVADQLVRLTDDQRQSYFQRLKRWLISYLQLDLMLRFHSIEIVEEAVISLPATRPVYDTIVTTRGFDPSRTTPQVIAETMTSSETDKTMHEAITLMSSFDDVELMEYFRDLYDKLAEFRPELWWK